ncbi:MAG: hypothetical protein QM783_16875 [Phycisphaerales bacterium]
MLAWIITTVVLAAAAGTWLIIVGWRGRPVNAEPVCRKCGFDLRGRFPWGAPSCPTCPDCGERLLTYKSVLNGERRRRPRILAVGCGLVFPSLILLIANGVDSITGGTLAAIKPTPIMAAQVAGSTRASASLRTLTARIADGKALQGDTAQVIERALALQADRSMPLDREWLDLLETARRRGQLTPAQTQRYFDNAVNWQLLVQPAFSKVPVLFAVQGFTDRLAEPAAGSLPIVLAIEYQAGTLDEKPLIGGTGTNPFGMSPLTTPLKSGSLIEMFGEPGHAAQPGPARMLSTTWKLQARAGDAKGPVLATWTRVLAASTDVGARRPFQPPEPRSDQQAEMQSLLAFEAVRLERDASGACWASIQLHPVHLPFDVAATLRITTEDGLQYRSLMPVEITPSDPLWTLRTAANPASTPWNVRVQLDGLPLGATATVELLPIPDAGSYTLANTVWGPTPLKFTKVQLDWSSGAAKTLKGQ